uniref:Glyco_tran_10_N domain-containing protein n=1 Tax=Heterorhabditis bacteriophora TaxID=37862 RepID=A0A1I7XPD8_HETBA
MGMKVRPGTVYRNLVFVLGGALLFYVVYSIIAFDDGLHIPIHRRQKHLYLTVSKDRIGHRFEKLAPKRILMWTKVFDIYPTTDYLSDCKGYSDRCIIDSNRSILPVADAIVFHARDINGQALPNSTERKPSQRYVFMSMEAPPNSGRSKIPSMWYF